jgi:predicted nuclease of restriction endonuclease-like (RecB) superfamily
MTTTIHQLMQLNRRYAQRLLPSTAWAIGRELEGHNRAMLTNISADLQPVFGPVFRLSNLREFQRLYSRFLRPDQIHNSLSWSHYRLLIRLPDPEARQFYMAESLEEHWSTRQLARQIQSGYYERMKEGKAFPEHYILEFAKSFSGMPDSEAVLERALLDRLQDFLLELGRGFAFVGRQKRLVLESGKTFFVDLVFYHFLLRCFVLIELKIGELTHRDIGQLDLYVRYYDHHYRRPADKPTVGLILCSRKDQTLVRYSMLNDHPHLFASTYQFHLPTEEELNQCLHTREKTCLPVYLPTSST